MLQPDDPAAVIADPCGEPGEVRRRAPDERAAHAEPGDADLAAFTRGRDRCGDVKHRLLAVELAGDLHALADAGLVVAELDALLDAVEHAGRDGEIARGRDTVGHRAD